MPAQRPEEVDNLFAQALNAGDLDALTALYEPQASLTPSPGTKVTGTAAIGTARAFVGNHHHARHRALSRRRATSHSSLRAGGSR